MAIEQFANAATTTVGAGGIDNSSTSLLVASSAAPFPQIGNFRILIDNEIMLVTAVPNSTHFTVTRGAEGTSAASHSAGNVVTHIMTAGSLNQFGADQVSYGTDANLPTAPRQGQVYLPSDNVTPYFYDGSAWQTFGLLAPLHTPPLAGSWTALNGPQTLTSYKGSLLLAGTTAAGDNIRGYYKATPATPYTVDIGFIISAPTVNYWQAGPMWYESGSGKLSCHGVGLDQANNLSTAWYWKSIKFNSVTSFNSFYNFSIGNSQLGFSGCFSGIHWVRLIDDGTNRTMSLSSNGIDWVQTFTIIRTDFITPDKIGFFTNPYQTYWGGFIRIISWYEH